MAWHVERKARLVALFCVVVTLAALAPPAQPQSITDVIARAKPAVVFIRLPSVGSGSGFIVHPDGFILTARHVVEGAGGLEIAIPGYSPMLGRVIAIDRSEDVAILKVDRSNLPTLRLGDSGQLRQGEEILVIGFPRATDLGALDASATRGIVEHPHDSVRVDSTGRRAQSGE